MVEAECPRMSRLTDSGTPHSAALVDQVWRRSWNVRFSTPASRRAFVNPVLMSPTRAPVAPFSKT